MDDENALDSTDIKHILNGNTEEIVKMICSDDQDSNFELSQQPNFDNLANKLLKEKNKALSPKTPTRRNLSQRTRAAKNKPVDEDDKSLSNVEFVQIPPTKKRSKKVVTEHELNLIKKRKFEPNYMNEDSECSVDKQSTVKSNPVSTNVDNTPSKRMRGRKAAKNEDPVKSSRDEDSLKLKKNDNISKPNKNERKTKNSLNCIDNKEPESKECPPAPIINEPDVSRTDDFSNSDKDEVEKLETTETTYNETSPVKDKQTDDVESKKQEKESNACVPSTPTSILKRKRAFRTPESSKKHVGFHHDFQTTYIDNEDTVENKMKSVKELFEKDSVKNDKTDVVLGDKDTLFSPLKNCNVGIEKIIHLFVLKQKTLSTSNILKNSFTNLKIKTIGNFASMSIKDVSSLRGIQNDKIKISRQVLSEYYAKQKSTNTTDNLAEFNNTGDSPSKEKELLEPLPVLTENVEEEDDDGKEVKSSEEPLKDSIMETEKECDKNCENEVEPTKELEKDAILKSEKDAKECEKDCENGVEPTNELEKDVTMKSEKDEKECEKVCENDVEPTIELEKDSTMESEKDEKECGSDAPEASTVCETTSVVNDTSKESELLDQENLINELTKYSSEVDNLTKRMLYLLLKQRNGADGKPELVTQLSDSFLRLQCILKSLGVNNL